MPYVNNQGVRIHYEVEGGGPPLMLVGGIGLGLEFWQQAGYVEPLKNDYQLILIDTRGHGGSDKPHDPEAYKLALLVSDVVAVLDDLSVSKAHYLGYSLGGGIGYAIAKYAPERFHSLVIGGMHPWLEDPEAPSPFLGPLKSGMEAWLARAEAAYARWWTPELRAIQQSNDLDALIAMISLGGRRRYGGVAPGSVTLPCLLYVGEDDDGYADVVECAKYMPNATLVSFPGLDHIEAIFRSDLVVPHVKKFLAEVGEG